MPAFPPIDRYIKGVEEGVKEGYAVGLAEGKKDAEFITHATEVHFGGVAKADETALLHYPNINLPRAKTVDSLFEGCEPVETIGNIDAPNATSAVYMFNWCLSIKSIGVINIPKVTSVTNFMYYDGELENIDGIIIRDLQDAFHMFYTGIQCKLRRIGGEMDFTNVTRMPLFDHIRQLEEFGVVAGSIHASTNMGLCTKLTAQSWESVFYGLADLTGQTACTITVPKKPVNPIPQALKDMAVARNWSVLEA